MDKQVEQVSIESTHFSNGNANSGQRYNFDVSNYDINIDPEFYTGDAYNKALSGFLRQNLRGMRTKVSLEYDTNLESNLLFDLTNDLLEAFVNQNADSVTFYPDTSKIASNPDDNFGVVLENGYKLLTSYTHTIGNFEPTIELISVEESNQIPDYLIAP